MLTMKKNKAGTILWVMFMAFIVFGLGGLLLWQQRLSQKTELTPPFTPRKPFVKTEPTEADRKKADAEALTKALKSGVREGCNAIVYDESLKARCGDTVAYAKAAGSGEEQACDGLLDEGLKGECRDKVLHAAALDTFDTGLCEKITNATLRTRCLNGINGVLAVRSANAGDCGNLKEPAAKTRCQSVADANEEVLKKALALAQSQSAAAPLLPGGCGKLKGSAKTSCEDQVNFRLAFEKKDLSYCGRLQDAGLKTDCLRTQGAAINRYYLMQAQYTQSAAPCQKIPEAELRSTCLASFQ